MTEHDKVILSYRFKLRPTRAQHQALCAALEYSRQLYNAALEERIDCYRKTGRGRSFYDQCRALTELRKDGSIYSAVMERAPLHALDKAFKAFFARGGFPRFRGRDWFKSIGWPERNGWQVKGRSAGPKRNQRMIDEGKPDAGVAFPGGDGTADMAKRIKAAGLPLWDLR